MRPVLSLVLVLLAASHALAEQPAVGEVPEALRARLALDPFYEKHVDAGGLPIVSSGRVSDFGLLEAEYLIEHMLAARPDVLKALVRNGVRCAVMAFDEYTTSIPEHKTLEPGRYWDRRARGLGASKQWPCVSCAEENLLGYPGDPYATECILVHEFAHAIDLMGLRTIDPDFEKALQKTFDVAMEQGLWKGLYASTKKEEYWAEGVQSWFHTNRPPDQIHNHVDTRAELEAYDPGLARLISQALGPNPWRYVHPRDRKDRAHLTGYDPAKAPTFAWPKALDEWYRRYEADKRTGAGRVDLPSLAAATAPDRSPTSLLETRILFVNQTDERLLIAWLDHDGIAKPYGEVGAHDIREQTTLVGHVWLLTNTLGREVARFVAAASPGRAVSK